MPVGNLATPKTAPDVQPIGTLGFALRTAAVPRVFFEVLQTSEESACHQRCSHEDARDGQPPSVGFRAF